MAATITVTVDGQTPVVLTVSNEAVAALGQIVADSQGGYADLGDLFLVQAKEIAREAVARFQPTAVAALQASADAAQAAAAAALAAVPLVTRVA
jgi:hypothetical protein